MDDPAPRLLLVVHSAKRAGAQLVALGQARALAAEHDLVIAVGHGPLRPRFAELGRLVRGPARAPVWGASRPRWALDLARALPDAVRLAAVVRRAGARAIVANSSVLLSPVLAGRLARVPVVVHVQEAPTSAAARRLLRFHGAAADVVVAISPWIAEALAGARAEVVVHPVGIPLPPPPAARPPRAAAAPLRLLVLGTIDAHKRQDVAVDALARLRAAGVDARLALVGAAADPAYGAALRRRIEDAGLAEAVALPGAVADVAAPLAAADVLLVPAGEVTPLVLMEAMAHRVPVVAARMGGIPGVVVDGESGLLVRPGDPVALADGVGRLARDPALAARLAAGGRRRVEACFDERAAHDRLRALLAAHGAPGRRAA